MENQEKWNKIVDMIEEMGWELHNIAGEEGDEMDEDSPNYAAHQALMGLRFSIEELREVDLDEE